MYTLYLGNKNYSSWSLRPWLLLRHFGIPFEERPVSVGGRGFHPGHLGYSPSGLVPCLYDGDFAVWDSLAIAEFLAERHPGLWPADPRARARARSISAEMHSGFAALRTAMPMNVKFRLKGKPAAPAVQREIDRVSAIWSETRETFGGETSPYLFGDFSVADALYAPVVWRFVTYNVPLEGAAAAYRDCMLDHPAMLAWAEAARAEQEVLAHTDALVEEYGGKRD